MDGAECIVGPGEVVTRAGGLWQLPDGTQRHSLVGCRLDVGSALSLGLNEPTKRPQRSNMDPEKDQIVERVIDDGANMDAGTVSATVVEPDPTPVDLTAAKELAGDNPMIAVVLAVVAVAGSGAGWKLWTKRSEQAHELAMRKLEISAQVPTAQPPPCVAAQAATDAKIAALEARIGKTEQSMSGLSVNGNDTDERIDKLEAAIRRMGVKSSTKKVT